MSSIREIKQNGVIVALEAYSGYQNGQKVRQRFGIKKIQKKEDAKYENAIKPAKTQAANFVRDNATNEHVDVARALLLLEPLNIGLFDAVKEFASLRESTGLRSVWTFRQAICEALRVRRDMKTRPQHLRGPVTPSVNVNLSP